MTPAHVTAHVALTCLLDRVDAFFAAGERVSRARATYHDRRLSESLHADVRYSADQWAAWERECDAAEAHFTSAERMLRAAAKVSRDRLEGVVSA